MSSATTLQRRNDDWKPAIAMYNPNGGASMTACIAFAALAAACWTRYFRTRPRPKWMLLLTLGTTMMSIGFICRFSRRNAIGAWSFLFETICILLSPCAFLAQDYVLIPRLSMHLQADDCLAIRRRWLVKMYVCADLVTFAAQLGGTALLASTQTLAGYGKKIITGGLWVQAGCFLSFVCIYVVFGRRLRNRPEHAHKWQGDQHYFVASGWQYDWRMLYKAIGVSCILVTIRSIFRIVEFTGGSDSAAASNEVFLYIFDTVPMLLNVVLFLLMWPPHCLTNPGAILPLATFSSPALANVSPPVKVEGKAGKKSRK